MMSIVSGFIYLVSMQILGIQKVAHARGDSLALFPMIQQVKGCQIGDFTCSYTSLTPFGVSDATTLITLVLRSAADSRLTLSHGLVFDSSGMATKTTTFAAGRVVIQRTYSSRHGFPFNVTYDLEIPTPTDPPHESGGEYLYPLKWSARVVSINGDYTFRFTEDQIWYQNRNTTGFNVAGSGRGGYGHRMIDYTFNLEVRVSISEESMISVGLLFFKAIPIQEHDFAIGYELFLNDRLDY